MYIYNKVYSFLFVFLGLSHISAMAQNAVIERQYKTTYYSNALSCYKDTTCSIFFTIKDGRVVDASICVAAYDRVHVQAANISFNNNNISGIDSFLKTVSNSKQKYLEWSETAVKNKVLDFSKDMENKTSIKKHRMEINFCYDSLWYKTLKSNDRGLPMPYISPTFRVDRGICLMEIGHPRVLGERFSPKQRQGYIPSLWSAMITEAVDKQTAGAFGGLVAMQFRSEEQIQSFLDAFNIDDEILRLKREHQMKQAHKDSIDSLFK